MLKNAFKLLTICGASGSGLTRARYESIVFFSFFFQINEHFLLSSSQSIVVIKIALLMLLYLPLIQLTCSKSRLYTNMTQCFAFRTNFISIETSLTKKTQFELSEIIGRFGLTFIVDGWHNCSIRKSFTYNS